MKQAGQSPRVGVDAGEIRPFDGITPAAGQREIFHFIGGAVLLRDYVLDVKG
jgi:hypothetical protein